MRSAKLQLHLYRNRYRPMPGWRMALERGGLYAAGGCLGVDADDPLAAARGITLGLLLSLFLWAGLYTAVG